MKKLLLIIALTASLTNIHAQQSERFGAANHEGLFRVVISNDQARGLTTPQAAITNKAYLAQHDQWLLDLIDSPHTHETHPGIEMMNDGAEHGDFVQLSEGLLVFYASLMKMAASLPMRASTTPHKAHKLADKAEDVALFDSHRSFAYSWATLEVSKQFFATFMTKHRWSVERLWTEYNAHAGNDIVKIDPADNYRLPFHKTEREKYSVEYRIEKLSVDLVGLLQAHGIIANVTGPYTNAERFALGFLETQVRRWAATARDYRMHMSGNFDALPAMDNGWLRTPQSFDAHHNRLTHSLQCQTQASIDHLNRLTQCLQWRMA